MGAIDGVVACVADASAAAGARSAPAGASTAAAIVLAQAGVVPAAAAAAADGACPSAILGVAMPPMGGGAGAVIGVSAGVAADGAGVCAGGVGAQPAVPAMFTCGGAVGTVGPAWIASCVVCCKYDMLVLVSSCGVEAAEKLEGSGVGICADCGGE